MQNKKVQFKDLPVHEQHFHILASDNTRNTAKLNGFFHAVGQRGLPQKQKR